MNFEEALHAARESDADGWRLHIIAVADTMYICKKWFEDHAPKYTPSDIVAMAAIVVQRESIADVIKSVDIVIEKLAEIRDGE